MGSKTKRSKFFKRGRLSKSYPLNQSPLYRVTSKRRLSEVLGLPLKRLLVLRNPTAQYKEKQKQVKNKLRIIHFPLDDRMRAHRKIFSLLARITPPNYLHSGVKGRSFKTNAAAHQYCKELLKLDLKDFYPSTTLRDVTRLFRYLFECPNDVAELLAQICCYKNQVPVGSPVSQAIAFFAHKELFEDLNLHAISENIVFTCYVDDLTFSGEHIPKGFAHKLHRRIERTNLVWHKQKLFRSGQVKEVTGVIIDTQQKLSIPFKKHLRISALLREVHASHSLEEYESNLAQLEGLLGYRSYVDPTAKKILPSKPTRKVQALAMENSNGR